MKAEILVPTVQYGNIRFFVEGDAEEIIEEARRLNKLYAGGDGLPTKEFNVALDRYLTDGTGETHVYLAMNRQQQDVFQEIKKSLKRIKNHD